MPAASHTLRLSLAAMAVFGILAATGCGDDQSDGPPTKAEYIEQADAICQELYRQRDPLENQAAQAALDGQSDQAAEIFENAADITENRMAELRDLQAPEGDEEAVDEILTRGEATADTARSAADAIRNEDEKALADLSAEGRRNTDRFNKAAIEYGFFVCGRGVQATIG